MKNEDEVILIMEKSFESNTLEVERIFEKFCKEDRLNNIKGTGLGMAICKQLMELMEGKIEAEVQGDRDKLRFILFFQGIEGIHEKRNMFK
ncbi:MAG: hypothetical protein HFJ09_02920 [Lachnospiraceae bacterium]|nr:hypothetical protein [Lachnospiraceae bacterium]